MPTTDGTATFPTFATYFYALHGHAPYTWQQSLADYLVTHDRVPGRVSVPTGLGKTSTVDAVLWALARQVHLGQDRTFGLRIFVIVERRIIAEGAGGHIDAVVSRIRDAMIGDVLHPVREALRSLSATGSDLVAEAFHGTRRPVEEMRPDGVHVIATTASQYTLRIAGRTPGKGPAPRATEAGLAMLDAVVLFDEPHLASAQVHAVTTAIRVQQAFTIPGIPSAQISVLGATIPDALSVEPGTVTFTPDIETPAALARWRDAARPAEIITCDAGDAAVVSSVVEAVVGNLEGPGRRRRSRILVVVNTVAVAEKVAVALEKWCKRELPGFDRVRLVTGRFRATEALTPDDLGRDNEIMVSTQVVEAGADFTCDLLVTELAPWPALTQRVGRLNRDGSAVAALAVVVVPVKEKTARTEYGTTGARAVYGDSPLDATGRGLITAWSAANPHEGEEGRYIKRLQLSPDNHAALLFTMREAVQDLVDIDHAAAVEAWASERTKALAKQGKAQAKALKDLGAEPVRRVVTDTIFWPVQATPATVTVQAASAFLETAAPVMDAETWREGIDPQNDLLDPVTVAWRGRAGNLAVGDFSDVMLGRMPMAAETVQVPLTMARDLVQGLARADLTDGISDEVPEESPSALGKRFQAELLRRAVVFSAGKWVPVRTIRDVRPGSVLVIDSASGGYDVVHGVTTEYPRDRQKNPDHSAVVLVPDVSLRTALSMGRWAPLTEASLLGAGVPEDSVVEIIDTLYPVDGDLGVPDEAVTPRARARGALPLVREALAALDGTEYEVRGFTGDLDLQFVRGVPAVFVPRTGGVSGTVTLTDHLRQVGDVAGATARAAGLLLAPDVETAGWFHDVGKAHPDYQAHFNARPGELLAKPNGTPSQSVLPVGWRHEVASANALPDEVSDLTRWLVVSHHGRGRGAWRNQPDTVVLGKLRRELEAVYGPWGVAYLEATLRTADVMASAAPKRGLPGLPEMVTSAVERVTCGDALALGYSATVVAPTKGQDEYRLSGLAAASHLDNLAALGVAALLSLDDPDTTLTWSDNCPVLTTAADMSVLACTDEMWSEAVEELFTVGGRRIATQHHKLTWEAGPAVPAAVVAERAGHDYTSALAGMLAGGIFAPYLRMGETKGVPVAVIPSAMHHSNGSLFMVEVAAPDCAALTDQTAGTSIDPEERKRVGRMSDDPDAPAAVVRPAVALWALIGSLVAPQAASLGVGLTWDRGKRSREFVLPGVPLQVPELASLWRAGSVGGRACFAPVVTGSDYFIYTLPGQVVHALVGSPRG